MIDPVVRRAGPADADALAEIERAARAGVAETRGGRRWLDAHAEIGSGWSDAIDLRAVFVAVIQPVSDRGAEDVVVGYLLADLIHDPMAVARVDQVFVTADARELGFGDELVAAAMQWGRAAGAEMIEGEALPGDRDMKNLYERAGITARLITVSKRLA